MNLLLAFAGALELRIFVSALLHFAWQGALIALALRVALAALPRAKAPARYVACCAALVLMLLAPLATFWILLASAPGSEGWVAPIERAAGRLEDYVPLALLVAWVLGSGLMIGRLVFGVARLRGLVARAEAPPEPWQSVLARLAARVGLRQQVRLVISAEVDSPLVLGWLRPVIVVPIAALTSLPAAYVEVLLLHELGHVRRFDYLVNVVQSCVEALLFYHPAVHWASACMRCEREHCCDDIAIQVSGEPLGLARALAQMETLRARTLEPALGARGGPLLERIERIVATRGVARVERRACFTATGVLLSALTLSLLGAWACSTAAPEGSFDEASVSSSDTSTSSEAASLGIGWLPAELQRWQRTLMQAAHRYDVDPALLAIVTLVESQGDPAARSPSGAVGLMQLMPSTAASIAKARQLSGYSEARLLDPAYNVDLGAWLLSQQLAEFASEGDGERAVELALVAYNAGSRRAREYLGGRAALPRETERYRDLVVALWNEREQPESPTYAAWRDGMAAAGSAVLEGR